MNLTFRVDILHTACLSLTHIYHYEADDQLRALLLFLTSLLYESGVSITTHTEHHLQSTQAKEECSTKESKLLTVRGHRKQGRAHDEGREEY